MSISGPQRRSFDRRTRRLILARAGIWLLNAVAIAFLPVIAILSRVGGIFEGAELSGIVSGLLMFSILNLSLSIRHETLEGLKFPGKAEFIVLLAVALVLFAVCGYDTYSEAKYSVSVLINFGPKLVYCCLAFSFIIECYIGFIQRDDIRGNEYVITISQRISIRDDRILPGDDVESDIRPVEHSSPAAGNPQSG